MSSEIQWKANKNEEKLHLEDEKEIVLIKEKGKEILQTKISKDKVYENTLKDTNDDLAKVLKGNFKREDVVQSYAII